MPVILAPGAEDRVARPRRARREALHDLLVPLPADEVALRPVSSAVNDARHDEPDCLDAARAAGAV